MSTSDYRFFVGYWFEFIELDEDGNRIAKLDAMTNGYIDSNDVDVTIEKSITSTSDTATISVHNHVVIEELYKNKRALFENFGDREFEVDIMVWYENDPESLGTRQNHNMFTGSVDNISIPNDQSITDKSLTIQATSGREDALRTLLIKRYPSGTSYKEIVYDCFDQFNGFDLAVFDDPDGKLNKKLIRPKTYHQKVSDVLNDISRDVDMTWGFSYVPWTIPQRFGVGGDPSANIANKRAYFVDKRSIFDMNGIFGTGVRECNGSTGKLGRVGFNKSEVTFTHLVDDRLEVGDHVAVSDYGTMNEATEFEIRINRMSLSNNILSIEGSYIKDGLAVIEKDKDNSGALKL